MSDGTRSDSAQEYEAIKDRAVYKAKVDTQDLELRGKQALINALIEK